MLVQMFPLRFKEVATYMFSSASREKEREPATPLPKKTKDTVAKVWPSSSLQYILEDHLFQPCHPLETLVTDLCKKYQVILTHLR